MRQLKISKSITSREFQSLEKYFHEISKLEILRPEEEVTLAIEIRKGNQAALERLIKANLRFVVSVAKQYQNQGLTLPDLINEGNLGLIKAAQKFDETKGFKFISYAVWWIRQSVLQAIADQGRIVRMPLNQTGLVNRITKAHEYLEQELQREPSVEEIADLLDLSNEEVSNSMVMSAKHVSIDTSLNEEDESNLLDILENKNTEKTDARLDYNKSLQIDLDHSLKALSDRQKEVICFFYGIGIDHPLSLEDIGHRYSLTRERVRQIRDKAINKLKTTKRSMQLNAYLG